jgi:hypothetical protein
VGTIVLCQLFELWTWTECKHDKTGKVGAQVPGSFRGLRVELDEGLSCTRTLMPAGAIGWARKLWEPGTTRITDTVQWFPHGFLMLDPSPHDNTIAALADLSTALQQSTWTHATCWWRWHVLRLPVPSGESRIRLCRIPCIPGIPATPSLRAFPQRPC